MHDIRVVVTGAGGQLGTQLCETLGPAAIGLSRNELDLTNRSSIDRAMRSNEPDVLVNTAAYTQVDRAESDAVDAGRERDLERVGVLPGPVREVAGRAVRRHVGPREGGELVDRPLRLQHARPERNCRPAYRGRQFHIRQRVFRTRVPAVTSHGARCE